MTKIITLAAVAALGVAAAAQNLKVGDPAPKLEVAKWVKGAPIKEFAPDKVYVVEFWATWCGPCKQSIPHLTELAKKHKDKVTIIGLNSFEVPPGTTDTGYMQNVEKFVQDMGDQMGYTVAIDGPEGKMAYAWMKAAAQNGIPTAFIVKNKQIQWIGHPMQMDSVLEQVIAGTWDVQAARAQFEKEAAEAAEMERLTQGLMDALNTGDSKKALEEIDKIIAARPEMKPLLMGLKVEVLFDTDPAKAIELAKELAKGDFKEDPMFLNNVAWRMVEEDEPKVKMDYALALEWAKKACELTQNSEPMFLDTLAMAQYRNGMKADAIATVKKAIALLEKDGSDPELLKELRDRLKKFEGK
jgi:thiol-disulfide isomerase/thioredoxin